MTSRAPSQWLLPHNTKTGEVEYLGFNVLLSINHNILLHTFNIFNLDFGKSPRFSAVLQKL